MSITVVAPGMLTTVQDQGRTGYQQYGMPVSGAVDLRAAAVANILAGNDQNEAVLECTLLGPRLKFERANCVAVTGGDLGLTVDGSPVPTYRAFRVEAGQVLGFTAPVSGCRAYIAFSGGLDIPVVMGSRSTYIKAGIGGFGGRKLQKGDVIAFRSPVETLKNMASRAIAPEFLSRKEYVLRAIPGPQDDCFTRAGIDTFFGGIYTVTAEFDRMGCRFEGDVIEHKNSADIISDGISLGAIQVPASGKPIMMLSDRQTTGGYAKIANVITADMRIAAQLKQGDKVRFEKVSVEDARQALLAQRAALSLLQTAVAPR